MGNLNYISVIAKILEVPSSIQLKQNNLSLYFVTFRVQLPSFKKQCFYPILTLIVWGSLAYEIIGYYKVNDYVLIEGHMHFQSTEVENYQEKSIIINVRKIFPFFLNNQNYI